MIKIRKDTNEKIVTQGAYKNFYEHLGYEIVKDKPVKKEVINKEEVIDKKEEVKETFTKNDKVSKNNYSRK